MLPSVSEKRETWLDRPVLGPLTLSGVTILFLVILMIGIFTRFYDLGSRVMSHDETSHVIFSWFLAEGRGYQHDPVTHGPLQFHLIALSYFLFGDTDFTARIPAVLFSIATIAFIWNYRRYLGRAGMLVAALLITVSPYMLFYGRYVRNEALVGFFAVVTLWAVLAYLETGLARYTYYLTAALVLHYATKETAWIYTAQLLLFLAFLFLARVTLVRWNRPERRNHFLLALIVALLFLTGAAAYVTLAPSETVNGGTPQLEVTAGEVETIAGDQVSEGTSSTRLPLPALALSGLALAAVAVAGYFLIDGFTWPRIRAERSFDLLMLTGSLVLPLLVAFPLNFLGRVIPGLKVPVSVGEVNALTLPQIVWMGVVVVIVYAISIALGLWWNRKVWLYNAALFWSVFLIFYTTLFTNGAGFITGLIGGLGYWLVQQEVERGSQPWYYYALVQVPVYEYLPALGSLLAGLLVLLGRGPRRLYPDYKLRDAESEADLLEGPEAGEMAEGEPEPVLENPPVFGLLGFWSLTSLFAYTYAGEKMPWLTVHITLPMILLAAWAIGHLIERTDWRDFRVPRGYLALGLLLVLVTSFSAAALSVLGPTPPFAGKTLEQLAATSTFLLSALAAVASSVGLAYLVSSWTVPQTLRLFTLTIFALLALLTTRTAFTASFINYDNANELLVYAHSGPGNKVALEQIEEISRRTTNGLDIQVAYDNGAQYPFWWYLRNYPKAEFKGATITREFHDFPIIVVGHVNYPDIERVVRNDYYAFEYIRMWWPNQDYYDLTWERIRNALTDPQMRAALFEIWLNRDYTMYGRVANKVTTTSLPTWDPAQTFRLYLRKDLVSQMWNYGASAGTVEIESDPYEGKQVVVQADQTIGGPGTQPGQFSSPRDVAVAPDGSLYVADTSNHRIQHFAPDGSLLHTWGSLGRVETGSAPEGTFNEPWGVAVGPDGSVYVSDTWNHRIQKFTPEGEFIDSWGFSGQAETPFSFWGPRDVAVGPDGRVFVSDTGNKRLVVFDADGEFITAFGGAGLGEGNFDEPVGLAVDAQGNVYIADTWNMRIQVVAPTAGGYVPLRSWEIAGWYGQSWDNKPYLTVGSQGNVFASDPEGYRVLEFTPEGQIVRYWGDLGAGPGQFGKYINGVAADNQGGLWVADSANGRVLHFTLPEQ